MCKLVILVVLIAVVACEGAVGPTGPAGPAGQTGATGLQGPPGLNGASADISWGIVTLDGDGGGVITFVDAQITSSVVTCYISATMAGPWILVASGFTGNQACSASNSGANLLIRMTDGPPGVLFLATVSTV